MRELAHENLAKFVGISLNGPTALSVYQFCGKGSLQDVFDKHNLPLDWYFKYSLIRDLSEVTER